ADMKGDKIQNFSAEGEHRSNFGAAEGFFASKKKEGRVSAPRGMAVNEKGSIYVADSGNKRIDAFGPDGTFLFGFGPHVGPYELGEPVAVVYDEAGFVYVLDRELKKVLKCEPSGGFIKAWGDEGRDVGRFVDPVALAYDGRSYLYVLDRALQRVSVFDRDGEWVTNFFSGGADERSLSEPRSLIVMDSELVVADWGRDRVVSFSLHPRLAPPVAVSTKAVEGEAVLEWEPREDPWIARYRIYRSSLPYGPFFAVGETEKPRYKDSSVEAYQSYYYRISVEAVTGDLGPVSRTVETFIPGAFNVSPIEISTFTIGNIFSSKYKWYVKNPLGKAVVVNNLNLPFQNVKVSFRLKDFMDFATEKVIERLGPKEKVEVSLVATLSNRILEVTEDTPIQSELTVTYHEKGNKQDVSQAMPLKVYSRNAITWEDPRRIANFVTPKDPPVKDLANEVKRLTPEGGAGVEYLNQAVVEAVQVWTALGSLGVKFVTSPNNPFAQMSEDPAFPVDYTQFPRETLRRKSGECDDLVTLIASMLEGIGVRTAILDYPGHLALMFDTGANDLLAVGLPEDRLIKYQDTYWVPLEATMVGSPFEAASSKALHAYKQMSENGNATITDPRSAWLLFEPATLPKSEQAALKPDLADYEKRFKGSAVHYIKARHSYLSEHLQDLRDKTEGEAEKQELSIQLGILDAQHGKYGSAGKRFSKVLEGQPDNAAALNNLGSLAFAQGKYDDALKRYGEAAKQDPADAGIWMNMVRTAVKMGKKGWAKDYAKKAVELDKSLETAIESLIKL
ncbi:tetratricopeptide repeat protein, partial [Elusimicrobiota bacterium]